MPAKPPTPTPAKPPNTATTITIDLVGCARCLKTEGHKAIVFKALTNPINPASADGYTHWSLCPTNGEPILLHWTPTQGQ